MNRGEVKIGSGSLCIIIALMMILPTGVLVQAAQEGDQSENAIDLKAISSTNSTMVNYASISNKIATNQPITAVIDGKTVSFTLREGYMDLSQTTVYGEDGKIDQNMTESVRGTRLFTGDQVRGADNVIAILTDDWVSFNIEIAGKTYDINGRISSSGDIIYSYSDSSMNDWTGTLENDTVVLEEDSEVDSLPTFDGVNTGQNESLVTNDQPTTFPSAQQSVVSFESPVTNPEDPQNLTQTQSGIGLSIADSYITTYQATILMGSDTEYRAKYPNDWATQILVPLWDINVRYTDQVSINFLPKYIVSVPSGQCTSTNGETLLSQWRTYLNTNYPLSNYPRDLAHLCTGKSLDNNLLGIAGEPGVNAQRWGFSSSSNVGLSNTVSSSGSKNANIMGHEIGHQFNGDHTFAKDWLNSGWGSDSWMWPTYGWLPSMRFTEENAQRIRSWAQQTIDTYRTISFGPSSTSSQSLQASNLDIISDPVYTVGRTATVSFQLKNTGSSTIILNYVFVGARDASGNNRDFGYIYNVVIAPGSTFTYSASLTSTSSGTWTIWPAYNYQGGWGPYQWMTLSPTLYYKVGTEWTGKDIFFDYRPWTLFYRFTLYSLSSTPTVGSTIYARFSIFNGQSGTGSTTHINSIFVGCRDNYDVNRDFGWSGGMNLANGGDSGIGAGYLIWASRTLDSSGTWQFWPAFQDDYGYGPYQWHMATITA